MSDHKHTWTPLAGEQGRYECGCGVTGWRHLASGEIRAHRQKPQRSERWTAMDATYGRGDGFGRVRALPSLDQTERRRR